MALTGVPSLDASLCPIPLNVGLMKARRGIPQVGGRQKLGEDKIIEFLEISFEIRYGGKE
jgi:hypothetical protein